VRETIDILSLGSSELADIAARVLPSGAGLAGRIYSRVFEVGKLDLTASVYRPDRYRPGASDSPLPSEYTPCSQEACETEAGSSHG